MKWPWSRTALAERGMTTKEKETVYLRELAANRAWSDGLVTLHNDATLQLQRLDQLIEEVKRGRSPP